MYRQILIALDGSELAESILPYVEPLAERFGARLIVVRATLSPATVVAAEAPLGVDPAGGAMIDPTPILEADREDSAAYLSGLAQRLTRAGHAVDQELPEGPAAEAILELAQSRSIDLIAMTTHGRGGLGRVVFGSVADAVLRHAPCPMLVVRVHPA